MKLLAVGMLGALCGCAANGTPYKDHPAHTEPVPENLSRIVVYRLDRAHNSTVAAALKLDHASMGSLRENGFLTRDVEPGAHALDVDLPTEAGTCNLPLQIASGETGYFLVAARSENAAARTPGAIAWMLSQTFGASLLGEVYTELGAAIESAGKQCGGPFSVVRVLPAVALAMIMELRESTGK